MAQAQQTNGEDLLQRFLSGEGAGWAGLDEIDSHSRESAQQAQWRQYEQAVVIAKPFQTPDGRAALAKLRELTTEQPTFAADLAAQGNGDYAVYQGFAREGQNSIVRWIEAQIAIAEAGPPTGEHHGGTDEG